MLTGKPSAADIRQGVHRAIAEIVTHAEGSGRHVNVIAVAVIHGVGGRGAGARCEGERG